MNFAMKTTAFDWTTRPTLHTARCILRPFALDDVPQVLALAGAREVAATTLHIPHPYPPDMAAVWIDTHQPAFEARRLINFAIETEAQLCGCIGLGLDNFRNGELGYWLGVPFWNRGLCSEAAREIARFAFETLQLPRVHACHLASNLASGRVMQKIGMTREGVARQHIEKWGERHDLVHYGMLREEWLEGFRV